MGKCGQINRLLKRLGLIFFLLIASGIQESCRIDDELYRLKKTKWAPEFILPLVNAELSIEEILTQNRPGSLVGFDQENRIILSYEGELDSKYGYEIIAFGLSKYELLAGQSSLLMPLIESYVIESILFKTGELQFGIQGVNRDEIGEIQIEIDGLMLGNQPFSQSFGSIDELQTPIDLSSALWQYLGTKDNRILIDFRVFDLNGLDITDGFKLFLEFRSLAFERIRGWFDQFSLSLSKDTIELDIFKRWKQGVVYLDDPSATLSFENSFGIPLAASLSTFNAFENGPGSTIVPFSFSNEIGDTFALKYPNSVDVEGYVNSTYTLNQENSNIGNIISISPDMIEYDLSLVAKHDVDLFSAGEIGDSSKLVFKTRVDLPLTGRLQRIIARDTYQVAAAVPKELSALQYAAIVIETENALPMGVKLQCYLLDENRIVYDSVLVSSELLKAGKVDARGRVIEPSNARTRIELNNQQISKLDRLKYVGIQSILETSEGGSKTISFYGNDFLGIQLRLEASYQIL